MTSYDARGQTSNGGSAAIILLAIIAALLLGALAFVLYSFISIMYQYIPPT
jgi:hypothetical protein